MEIGWITLHVKDLEESIWFYQEVVGLKIARRFPAGPGREIAFMEAEEGGSQIELVAEEGADGLSCKGMSIGFKCPDVIAKHKEMTETGFEPSQILTPSPNISFFYVKDPDGVNVQFAEETKE